jgi:hypothetical protein
MPRNPNYQRIDLQLTPLQYTDLANEAAKQGIGTQDVIIQALAAYIVGFPAHDKPKRGKYVRKAKPRP